MHKTADSFGLKLENIPLINLRNEFNNYHQLLQDKKFRAQFDGPVRPIKTPYLRWYKMPNDLLTLILQRAILGVEAYIPGAVLIEMGHRGLLNRNKLIFIRNPFKLGGRSTVDNYYHLLPGMLDEKCSLKVTNNSLWDQTKKFYTKIRNPIFHGYQVSNNDIDSVLRVFQHLAAIYDWIDVWHSPNNIIPGAGALSTRKGEKKGSGSHSKTKKE